MMPFYSLTASLYVRRAPRKPRWHGSRS